MSAAIPLADLVRARRRFHRQIASVMIGAMCFRDKEPSDIDAALQWTQGETQRFLSFLVMGGEQPKDSCGETYDMEMLAKIAVVLDCCISLTLVTNKAPEPPAAPEVQS